MDIPLSSRNLMRHGTTAYGDSQAATWTGSGARRATYQEGGARAARLANALRRLGVSGDQRVATLMWNNQEHLEAYLAIPSMGVVLGEQLHHYEERFGAETDEFAWPEIDERQAAAMCYTSGTTGNPKGVGYSHRSSYLHSMQVCMGVMVGLSDEDCLLPVVPMFHANVWGLPYAAMLVRADLVMPDRFLQAEPLARMIASERPSVAGAVPSIRVDLLEYCRNNPSDPRPCDWSPAGVRPCHAL